MVEEEHAGVMCDRVLDMEDAMNVYQLDVSEHRLAYEQTLKRAAIAHEQAVAAAQAKLTTAEQRLSHALKTVKASPNQAVTARQLVRQLLPEDKAK